jgi:sigma-B regulation protein RsbU (phosphoserine phosphatase)
MRRHGFATPVLMLTADDQEDSRVRGFEAGADDYVSKPFSIRELLGRVQAIIRRSGSRSDLDEARRIQNGLLPAEITNIAGLSIATLWRPALAVGGDYFDVLKLGHGAVAVCIADVCGKGIPAAMMMSNLQATVKAYASERMSPRELCERVNRMMCANTLAHRFVSFFYAVFDADRKRLTYCNAGHNPPILCTGSGAIKTLDRGGAILGVLPDGNYDEQEIHLDAGDSVLMYTDGLTECRSPEGEEFGERRLIDLVQRMRHSAPVELTDALLCDVTQFSNGKFEDDLTVLAVGVIGAAASSVLRPNSAQCGFGSKEAPPPWAC